MDTLKAEQYGKEVNQPSDPIIAIAERRRFRKFIKPVAERISASYIQAHNLPSVLQQGLTALQTAKFVQVYKHLSRRKYVVS